MSDFDLLFHKISKVPRIYAWMLLFIILLIMSLVSTHQVSSKSLLKQGGLTQQSTLGTPRSFYENYKAKSVGDVITVKVIESVDAIKVADINLDTQTDHDALLKFSQNNNTSSTLTPTTNDRINMTIEFAVPVDYGKSRSRSIAVDNQDSLVALVSSLVVEVDSENGNMVVEGSRQILIEGQTKSLYVRGVLNPKDLDANNEVPSYKLANAQIQIIGNGALTKERDKGVVQKIFRSIF